MAAKSTKSRSSAGSNRGKRRSNGRTASQKTEKYRFATNVEGEGTVAEREYRGYATADGGDPGVEPDVLLDVPVLKVDKIHLELDDLQANVALRLKVLDLVNLNVGVDVHLGKLSVDIEGVEAQALLKVRLDHVAAIVDRVMTTIDRNPELVKSLGRAVEDVGSGTGHTLAESGEAVEDVGEGTEEALAHLGEGAGGAVGQVGQGAGQAVGQVGEGAGQAVGNVDQLAGGLGQAVGEVGEGAGQAVGGVGEGAGGAAQGAGEAAGQLGQGAGEAGAAANGNGAGSDVPSVAKQAAKTVAKELGTAASDEAKDIGLAATRKVKELGERRRQRRAEKHHATEAAMRRAEEIGVDLDDVDGTGADGRITVDDVRKASAGQ